MTQLKLEFTAGDGMKATYIDTAKIRVGVAQMQEYCHYNSLIGGWWTGLNGEDLRQNPAVMGWKLALIHSEVSEATEGLRKNKMDDHLTHRPMAEVELADAIIRALDLAGALGYDIAGAMLEKLEYNSKRLDHKPTNRALEGGKKY